MRVDRDVIDVVAAEVVLQLIVDGHIVVSPTSVAAVEREVAKAMFQALLREDARGREATLSKRRSSRGALPLEASPGHTDGFLWVVEEMIRAIRLSLSVDHVLADDATLVREILSVIALTWTPRGSRQSFGGMGSPPSSAGGCPAEVRAWEVRRGETPPDPDPERRERGRKRWKRGG